MLPTDQKFKAGDIVRIRSGGSAMTVGIDQQERDDDAYCVWLDGESHFQEANISSGALIVISRADGSDRSPRVTKPLIDPFQHQPS